ncbi:DUF3732 domain-containing protein [Priestia megaterium]
MNFNINKLLLWLENGKVRTLEFEENKVNIITGDSETGKSEILSIIDYCFFASKADITEEKINKNVSWYGLNFNINDKVFTIARGKIRGMEVSTHYYFSSNGTIPETPYSSISEDNLKLVIDKEFSITERTTFPYGGRKITLGSKISPRYFLMFNTQSGDVISHSEVFFDKQNNDRYREALDRIFDLAIGIETEKNLAIKEKLNALNKDINRLKKKEAIFNNQIEVFSDRLRNLSKKAKLLNLIDYNEFNMDVIYKSLREIVENYNKENITTDIRELDKLKTEKNRIVRKIRNMKRFKNEYDKYKKLENNTLDSLKPVKILKDSRHLLHLPDLNLLLNSLDDEYTTIKKNITNKQPFDFNLDKKIKDYELEVNQIDEMIEEIPIGIKPEPKTEIDRLIFIGELKAELSLYSTQWNETQELDKIHNSISSNEKLKKTLEKQLIDYQERKESTLRLLEELIQGYIDKSNTALADYKGYKAVYNYKNKKLELRQPKSPNPTKVGSSSNHLFLHLCLFLGLHELIIIQQSPYVPQLLILDQPSRPYFGDDKDKASKKKWQDVDNSDRTKITKAMELINDFIIYINKELNTNFQIIVLEHIPKSIWEDKNLDKFQLVEEFRDGNALIRFDKFDQPY